MISDLPHVNYNPKDHFTQEEEQRRIDISHDMHEKIKEGGLKNIKGLNLQFGKTVDGDALLASSKE